MKATDGDVDWDELKARLHREIWEFAGPDLHPAVPGGPDELPGWWEWTWYRSKPEEERRPPGLTAEDFGRPLPWMEGDRAKREAEAAERK